MKRADEVSAISYRQTLNQRARSVDQFNEELAGRVLLLPTAPILPPTFRELQDDDAYNRLNLLVLRNPTIANFMDGCSISLPFSYEDECIGIMLIAAGNSDIGLLDLAENSEPLL